MPDMQSSDEYSIGIDEIDRQHRVLFDLFAQVEQAIRHGGRWTEIHYPLVRLREYTRLHFGAEESLMRISGYPETEKHEEEHRGFLQKLQSLENKSLHAAVTSEMTQFLRHRLVSHIMQHDIDYARYFANGGSIAVRIPHPSREQASAESPPAKKKD